MSNKAVTVIYDEARRHVFSGARDQRLVLDPGKNRVDAGAWKRFADGAKANPVLRALMDMGKVRVLHRDGDPSQPAQTIDEMSAPDAILAVKNTADLDDLTDIEIAEKNGRGRKTVLDAIADHREYLEQLAAEQS